MSQFRNYGASANVNLDGITLEGVEIKESRYTHEQGHEQIARESAQELYGIFRDTTYAMEQVELQSVHEGYVCLEGTSFQPVHENFIKKGYDKVVEFIKKLWAKVKAFFADVRRYLDGVFMDAKAFAEKYEKQLKDLKLSGYKMKLYKYDHAAIDKKTTADDMDSALEGFKTQANRYVGKVKVSTNDAGAEITSADPKFSGKSGDSLRDMLDDVEEKTVEVFRDKSLGVKDKEDEAEAIFKMFRNGATGEADKEETTVDVKSIISTLKSSKTDSITSNQSKLDGMYKKAIKFVEDKAKADGASEDDKAMIDSFSRCLSQMQTLENAIITGQKAAFNERANEYKKALAKAFTYKEKK